jgi:hypothetical protein
MYKKKCLFKNSNAMWGKEPTAQESVYAYLYGTGDSKSTGRYRIRITKMSAADLIQMGVAVEGTPPDFFGMQASLDKWHLEQGWIPMFDWVGDPEASLYKIEKDLNEQFKSFITGLSLEEDFSFDLPKPPKAKPIKLPKDPKKPVNTDPEETSGDSNTHDDDPDFEWL